jgi:hypothetical protein
MGRTLVFLARILQDGRARYIRDIAVDLASSADFKRFDKLGSFSTFFCLNYRQPL